MASESGAPGGAVGGSVVGVVGVVLVAQGSGDGAGVVVVEDEGGIVHVVVALTPASNHTSVTPQAPSPS